MTQDCTHEHAADSRYRASVARRMRPMASKSIEPVPAAEATAPSKSTVVASESTLGPTMENAVEAMANRNTSRSRPLNCPMKASIRFMVGPKASAFSPPIMRAAGPWPPGPCPCPWPPGPRRGPPPALGMKEGCPLIAHPLPQVLPRKAATGRFRGTRGSSP